MASGNVAPGSAAQPVVPRHDLTREELLARMDLGLREMALGDIKRASRPGEKRDGGAKMAGFLLGFCFIDAAAGFHAGRTREMRNVIGKHFRAFVRAYLPRYEPDALYNDLRNGLVHSYAIGETYAFTHLESDGPHLQSRATGLGVRILLNLEDFVSDLERAYEELCRDIRVNPTQFAKAKRRYESIGLIRAT
jgi:hypothetical protein